MRNPATRVTLIKSEQVCSKQETPIVMPSLPAQENFADLRESANRLLDSTSDENIKRLVAIVGKLSYRCDLLEREVERIARATAV